MLIQGFELTKGLGLLLIQGFELTKKLIRQQPQAAGERQKKVAATERERKNKEKT